MIGAIQSNIAEALAMEQVDRSTWELLAGGFIDYNYQQTWAYGQALAQKRRALSEHVVVRCGERVIGMADVRIRQLPVIGGGIAYISSGPLVRAGESEHGGALKAMLGMLVARYVHERGLSLRILPPIGNARENHCLSMAFAEAGFATARRVRGYRTFLVDLMPSETQLRAALAQKWRNCLNASQRQGLCVEFGTSSMMLQQFNALLAGLVARKGFAVELDGSFYAGLQNDLSDQDKLTIGLVRGGGETHAGGVFALHGDTCVYLLGATGEAGMKSKGSYLMHWQVMQLARQRGLRRYDLGGIDPVGNPGVYGFKRGMGGEDLTAAGPFECSPTSLRHHLVVAAEWAHRATRRVIGRRSGQAVGA